MLLCDFANLQREAERLAEAGYQALHLDVMDGVFVPNLSYGLSVVKSLRRVTSLPLDVHLMIANPAQYIEAFREAGADIITFHAEATPHHAAVLEQIRRRRHRPQSRHTRCRRSSRRRTVRPGLGDERASRLRWPKLPP
jgi:ribulose-phosphate 3-epimerase